VGRLSQTLGVMNSPHRSIAEIVEAGAVELVHRNSLDEIERVLVEQGVLPSFAAKLVLLIPSAFAAVSYEPEGIEFPTVFQVGPPEHLQTLLYAEEPVYVEATRLATRWLKEEKPSLVARVLDWSAEANSIKEARSKGLTPTRLSSVHHGNEW